MTTKSLLFISRTFPPLAGVGSLRTAGFVRLLPEFGWIPMVITLSPRSLSTPFLDQSLDSYVPTSTRCVRVRDIPFEIGQWGRHIFFSTMSKIRSTAASSSYMDTIGNRKGTLPGSIARLFSLPDLHLGWAVGVMFRAREFISKCDAVYSCGLPLGSHLAAVLLSRQYGKPLLCDFRDPYIWPGVRKFSTRNHEKLGALLEKWIVCSADAIVTIGSRFQEEFATRYPFARNKLFTVMNGYDGKLSELKISRPGALRILHAGNLQSDTSLKLLLDACTTAIKDGDRIEIELLGSLDVKQLDLVVRSPIRKQIILTGRVTQQEVFSRMLKADVLFLESCGPIAQIAIRAKVFEYIRARRTILAITDKESALEELLVNRHLGYTCPPGDLVHLTSILRNIARAKLKRSMIMPDDIDYSLFSRRSSTARLASILDRLVS